MTACTRRRLEAEWQPADAMPLCTLSQALDDRTISDVYQNLAFLQVPRSSRSPLWIGSLMKSSRVGNPFR